MNYFLGSVYTGPDHSVLRYSRKFQNPDLPASTTCVQFSKCR